MPDALVEMTTTVARVERGFATDVVSGAESGRRASATGVVPDAARQTTSVVSVHLQSLLRIAAAQTGWTFDSLASHLHLKDRGHVHRLLSGALPLSADRIGQFPPDVLDTFARLFAESRGFRVVRPTAEQDAIAAVLVALGQAMTVMDLGVGKKSTGKVASSEATR